MENVDEGFVLMCRGKPSMAHNIVLRMVDGLLHSAEHIVLVDNFFAMGLFKELLSNDIYTIGTMKSKRVRLPS